MVEEQLLEHIMLDQRVVLFRRNTDTHTNANYYHWHQCLEILYISKGYGIVVVDSQQYTARPGRLFIFPPFRLHKVQIEDSTHHRYCRTVLHVDQTEIHTLMRGFPHIEAQFVALSSSNAPAQVYDLEPLAPTPDTLFSLFDRGETEYIYPTSEVAFLVMQVLSLLPRSASLLAEENTVVSTRIMQWVEQHYSEKFSLARLANDLGLSESYTSRIFHQQTGGNLLEYLLLRRLKKSCDLLRISSDSVDIIASKVGFTQSTYFITCFKKVMKETPLQYRKRIALESHRVLRA